jgi:serine/threonine-protein kinase RsbW
LEGIFFQQAFRSSYECLSDIGALIHKAAGEAGLDERSVYQVETAVDEACSNIIEHAYDCDDRGIIDIECNAQPGMITIKLHDSGKPFDPDSVLPPQLNLSLEDRPDHGLGLFFINRWMDSVKFEFSESEGNTLTLVKKAGKPS